MFETSNHSPVESPARERDALLALWAVPGLGTKGLETIRAHLGALGDCLEASPRQWVQGLALAEPVIERLRMIDRLGSLAELVRERAALGDMKIAFQADAAYPPLLRDAEDAPPVLFYRGPGAQLRHSRYVALVGSRRPENGFPRIARRFAADCAEAGLGVVSGAAMGVDRACHQGALNAGGESWAFLGSALDEIDPAQAQLLPLFLEKDGTFFSELPPGVRASRESFPRRNRLISGASHAVVIIQAALNSGSLYTASYARQQGRPVLVRPGPADDPLYAGGHRLLNDPGVKPCLTVEDVCRATRWDPPRREDSGRAGLLLAPDELSEAARRALTHVSRRPRSYEDILQKSGMRSAALTSALCELELAGAVVQHPGRLYEKV